VGFSVLGSAGFLGFSVILVFIWTISSVMMFPRTVFRLRSPLRLGLKPTPPLRMTFLRTPP